jgi:hypothetical protein
MNAYKGDKNAEGCQRLRNLIDKKEVSYEELKRIKNFFDTQSPNTDYMGDKKQTTPFILNGGKKMKHWVNSSLETARSHIKGGKKIKTDTGMMGDYYRKDDITTDVKSTKPKTDNVKIKTSHQKSVSEAIYEIDIMENIINIFNKNKESCHKFHQY